MSEVKRLRLRPATVDDEDAVHAGDRLMIADDFTFALFLEDDFPAWVELMARHGHDPRPPMVRGTFLLAEVDGHLVGRTSIRYELNDWLRNQGGHIGYCVLPDFRRRGYAREILRQSLIVARANGVRDALITCADGNAASIATIEGCGGRLDDERPTFAAEDGLVRRYWIR